MNGKRKQSQNTLVGQFWSPFPIDTCKTLLEDELSSETFKHYKNSISKKVSVKRINSFLYFFSVTVRFNAVIVTIKGLLRYNFQKETEVRLYQATTHIIIKIIAFCFVDLTLCFMLYGISTNDANLAFFGGCGSIFMLYLFPALIKWHKKLVINAIKETLALQKM